MNAARLAALSIMCLSLPALAQPDKSGADPAHRQAALELCEVMQMESTLASSINTMMDIQMQQNPMLQQHRPALDAFFRKHMSWEALKDDFLSLYMESFTETELREMIAFYQTPTGKKAIKMMPELVQKGAQIGMRRVQQNKADLQRLILQGAK